MNWSTITSLSCFDTMRHVAVGDPQHEYTTLSQYYPGMALIEGTVYFANADDYHQSAPVDRHAAFIVFTEDPSAIVNVRPGQNVGRFDNKEEFEACFRELAEEFDVMRQLEVGVQQFISMVSNNEGVQQEVDYISGLFDLPTCLADESLHYMAVSGNFTGLHPALVEEIEKGGVDPKIHANLRTTDIFRPIGIRRKTIAFDTGLRDHQDRIIYNNTTLIYIGTAIVGNISLFTAGSVLPRTRAQLLPTIAAALSMEFQKSDYWLENKGAYYTHLLSNYLRSDRIASLDGEEARLRFKVAGYNLKHFKYVVYFRMDEESFTIREVQSIAARIRKELPNAIFFIEGGNVTYLLSVDEFIETEDLGAKVDQYVHDSVLNQTSVRVGISSAFTNMSDMRRHFEQAQAAIQVGRVLNRSQSVYTYNNYRLPYMFSHLSQDIDYSMYLYPPLMGLIERDSSKGTQLAYTLYEYLCDPEHPAEVCKKLGIHKNTLYFRLNKAKEFMHHDYRLGPVTADIMLSFSLLKYHGAFNRLVLGAPEETQGGTSI